MKIVAKINGEDQSLAERLSQRGLFAKLVKGGVVIDLPVQASRSYDDPDSYEVPAEIKDDAKLFIDALEYGGAATNTGSGTIVCGLSGEALRPYYVPRGGHLANGTHAHFSVSSSCVTVTGYRHENVVTIEEHKIKRDGNTALIETKELWRGDLESLPNLFSRFQPAAEAANMKGNCYHCRCVHFAEVR